tara:strand:+ start:31323 stop:32216 length:894 start_codon:yes stop_codon:yes gene_type:complete
MPQYTSALLSIKYKFKDFKTVTKMGLSLSVVFSCIAGYLLAAENIDFTILFLLISGGYCMVGASNIFNQIIERDFDALMLRTKSRPIPMGRISVKTAFILAVFLSIIGLSFLYNINQKSAMLAAISIFIYTSVYTPLKQVSSFSVLAGAIPGAIPFMLGWIACTGEFSLEAGILFMIQFFWQFPHFWAIAWFSDSDYQKAGFRMLPTGNKGKGTALQIIAYVIWTILVCLAPLSPYTGNLNLSVRAGILIFLLGIVFLFYGFRLFKNQTDSDARNLMFMSIFFLTFTQIIYVTDKLL